MLTMQVLAALAFESPDSPAEGMCSSGCSARRFLPAFHDDEEDQTAQKGAHDDQPFVVLTRPLTDYPERRSSAAIGQTIVRRRSDDPFVGSR